jgi:hypothetical protein
MRFGLVLLCLLFAIASTNRQANDSMFEDSVADLDRTVQRRDPASIGFALQPKYSNLFARTNAPNLSDSDDGNRAAVGDSADDGMQDSKLRAANGMAGISPDAILAAIQQIASQPQLLNALLQGAMPNPSVPSPSLQFDASKALALLHTHGALPLPANLAPFAPSTPSMPGKPSFLDTMVGGMEAVSTLMILKALLPMLLNPAVVLQFTSPRMMTVNSPQLPSTFREANPVTPEYFHPYGNW